METVVLDDDRRELTIGDRAPNFVLPDESGRFVMFYERTQGRPVVLLLVPDPAAPHSRTILAAFRAHLKTLVGLGIDIYCLLGGPAQQQEPAGEGGPGADFLVWRDPAGKVLEAYWAGLGVGAGDLAQAAGDPVVALMLDANQRILNILSSKDETLAGQVRAFFDAQPQPEEPILRRGTAPVLIVPRLLSNAWCDRVLAGWSDQGAAARRGALTASLSPGGSSGAFRGLELGTSPRPPIEQPLDAEMRRTLQGLIGRRLAPELLKAFSFEAFRLGGLVAACQEYAVGEPQAFASTAPESSADARSFTLVVNVTAEAAGRGEPGGSGDGLVFPEFGNDSFWPRRGGALIFASDLLVRWHAASKVRRCFLRAHLKD